MYILKGFFTFPALADNAVGVVAPLGELSKDSLTYAKETGLYKNDSYYGVLLHSFQSHSSDIGLVPVSLPQVNVALSIGAFILENSLDNIFSSNRLNALLSIRSFFIDSVVDLTIGEMVTDGEYWMPEWISYQLKDTQSYIRIWTCDQSFLAQYDGFEYEFISPLENVDDFFRPRNIGTTLLGAMTFKHIVERIDEVRGVYPYTLLRTEEFAWIDVNGVIGVNSDITTSWTVLIYGRAGNDPDQIRLALIEWILARSIHTRLEWLAIFPTIFTPTEFIITPLWHQFAVPNQTIQSGLNSPMISLERAIEIASTFCLGVGYEPNDLLKNTVVVATPFRTLGMLVTGSAVNKGGLSDFRKLYPDYIGLPLASPDFARLSTKTQGWMLMLVNLLTAAETMTQYSIIPPSYSRTIRSGVVYAIKEYEGMQYLLVAKNSCIAALGLEAPYEPEFDPYDPETGCTDLAQLIHDHLTLVQNPHLVTIEQVGLASIYVTDYALLNTTAVQAQSIVADYVPYPPDPELLAMEHHLEIAINPHRVTKSQLNLSSWSKTAPITLQRAVEVSQLQLSIL